MAWIMLVVAGVFEWGWPVGLKLGWTDKGVHAGWLTISIISMVASGALLMLAQRVIPIGTAYAVWTGIGAVGTFVIGVLAFGDEATYARFLFVGLIIMGIVGLKLTSLT
jgi:quaternary ammonium compound-resistance protein SugE